MKSLHVLLLMVLCQQCIGIGSNPAFAQNDSNAVASIDEAGIELQSLQIATLISQLGSQRFADREAASAALLASGESALVGLRALDRRAPFEVRQRAEMIRQTIEEEKFTKLSKSFLLDLDGSQSYGLPAWRQYRELVGSTRCSKLMYLDMIRQQPELVRLVEEVGSSAKRASAVPNSLESMASVEAARLRAKLFALQEPRFGDAVGMLFAAAMLPSQTPIEISDIIISYERQGFSGYIGEPGYGNCLRKLMSAWLPKTHQSMAPLALDCALRHDLREGIEIAREHLTENFDGDTRTLAFYCLARFGNETDVPKLMPLLSDKRVIDQFARSAIEGEIHVSNSTPPGIIPRDSELSNNVVVRVNDLAVTTAMLLLDMDPTELYPRYESHSKLGFMIHSLAAPPEWGEEQQQRIDKWKQKQFPPQVGS